MLFSASLTYDQMTLYMLLLLYTDEPWKQNAHFQRVYENPVTN